MLCEEKVGFPGTPLSSWGLGDGKDSEISVLYERNWDSPGISCHPGDLEMGRTVGFQCCVMETGNIETRL